MKYLILLTTIISTLSWGMEGTKPIITMSHEFDSLVRKCLYPHTISHTIDIPEEGATFVLSSQLLCLHPKHTKLDIEKGTKSITISEVRNPDRLNITDNNNKDLATIIVFCNSK